MPITIKEIAAEAEVSYQAVSAVLNNKTNSRVSAKTRKRILQIAKERGYQVNFGYKLMHKQKTNTIAIIASMREMESEEYVRTLVLRLMDRFNDIGYATYFNNAMTTDPDHNLAQVRDMMARGSESFIFIGSPEGYEEIAEDITSRGLNYIGFKSSFERDLASDSPWASAEIIRFFLKEKGDNLKLLLPWKDGYKLEYLGYRFEGLTKVIAGQSTEELFLKYVYPIPPLTCDNDEFTTRMFEIGYEATKELMNSANPPSSLFYLSDSYALGGAKYLYENNYKVGEDILIAGFNNTEAVRGHVLPISSVEHKMDEIIEILLRESRKKTAYKKTLKPLVHIRTNDKENKGKCK